MSDEQLVEEMAESAHEAWMAAQLKQGTTSRLAPWGEEFMVPFAKLSERGREFDRVIMRAILRVLNRRGKGNMTTSDRLELLAGRLLKRVLDGAIGICQATAWAALSIIITLMLEGRSDDR